MDLSRQLSQLSISGTQVRVAPSMQGLRHHQTFSKAATSSQLPRSAVVSRVVRIANRDLNDNWAMAYALTGIIGIGYSTGRKICEDVGIDPHMKAKFVSQEDLSKIREEVANYTIEGDLYGLMRTNIQRKIDIKCYQGLRHIARLPVRGQRTKTNARSRKGRKKTVAGKKV